MNRQLAAVFVVGLVAKQIEKLRLQQMLEQFQILFQAIQDVKNEVKESETRINLKIENEVSKRIEAWYYQRK